MTTNRVEAVHMVQLILKYMSPYTAKRMLVDMDIDIAESTGNASLRDSIKMVLDILDDARTEVTWTLPNAEEIA